VETDSADVIRSPGTPVDQGGPMVTPSAAESARSVTELFTEHHLGLVRLALLMAATTQGELSDSGQVLSLAPGGRYALVQCIQFGWLDLDLRRFTPLPAYSPTSPGQVAIIYGVW
jgi:hypothetical protein